MMQSDRKAVKGKRVSATMVKRIAKLARPYRWMLLGFFITILAGATMTLVSPLLFRSIIDDAIPNQNYSQLNWLVGFIVAAALSEAGFSYLERRWSAKIGEGLIFDLRVALFDHVQRMPMAFFTRTQTGALISRMNNDVIGAQRAITTTLGQVASNAILVLLTLVTMVVLEWRLTLLALGVLPVFILPTKQVGRRLQQIVRDQMDNNATMNITMTERMNVAGAMLVKLFGSYRRDKQLLASQAGRVRDLGVCSALVSRAFIISLTLMGALGTALIYWVGGRLVISGAITIGTLASMGILVVRIYAPLTALTNARVDLMTALVSFERVFEVLDIPSDIVERPDAVVLRQPRGQVSYRDVWFAYKAPDGQLASLTLTEPGSGHAHATGHASASAPSSAAPAPSLQQVSFDIAPGQHTAIVGPSGAGKSTLISLLARLYDVDRGSITIDGTDVRDTTISSLRAAIGIVSQDPHLFHDTISANLKFVKPDASQQDIIAACRAAQIHDLIASLPDGYDTVVGERGYRLSGGEKQRLAIARVILKSPYIIVLDEATSHLDSENEAAIQAALADVMAGRTSLIVAHRLSTIVSADQILVLDEGRVVERGTHEQLLAADLLYADLYRTMESKSSPSPDPDPPVTP